MEGGRTRTSGPLPLDARQQRGFFAADMGAHSADEFEGTNEVPRIASPNNFPLPVHRSPAGLHPAIQVFGPYV